MRAAYPKLKAYCRERYGVDLLVVDLKWGVRHQPRDDQSTVDLCLKQIEKCQRTSIGPNFVVSANFHSFACVVEYMTP